MKKLVALLILASATPTVQAFLTWTQSTSPSKMVEIRRYFCPRRGVGCKVGFNFVAGAKIEEIGRGGVPNRSLARNVAGRILFRNRI